MLIIDINPQSLTKYKIFFQETKYTDSLLLNYWKSTYNSFKVYII